MHIQQGPAPAAPGSVQRIVAAAAACHTTAPVELVVALTGTTDSEATGQWAWQSWNSSGKSRCCRTGGSGQPRGLGWGLAAWWVVRRGAIAAGCEGNGAWNHRVRDDTPCQAVGVTHVGPPGMSGMSSPLGWARWCPHRRTHTGCCVGEYRAAGTAHRQTVYLPTYLRRHLDGPSLRLPHHLVSGHAVARVVPSVSHT